MATCGATAGRECSKLWPSNVFLLCVRLLNCACCGFECDARAISCIGTVLELYRRIGVPYRELGRGSGIIPKSSMVGVFPLKCKQEPWDSAAAGSIPFCRCVCAMRGRRIVIVVGVVLKLRVGGIIYGRCLHFDDASERRMKSNSALLIFFLELHIIELTIKMRFRRHACDDWNIGG